MGKCIGYEVTVNPGNDFLVQMTSDFVVTGKFLAWQEPKIENLALAAAAIAVGLAGIILPVWFMKRNNR
jgi:hypothetical protein